MQNTRKKKKHRPAVRRAKKAHTAPAAPATHLPGFDDAASLRPRAADGFATALEIATLLGDPALDDPALRRLCDPNVAASRDPERGGTWLPKPIGARWQIGGDPTGRSPVLAGLHALARHRAGARSGLPETCANMTDFCAQTRFPRAMLEYALTHGCPCRDAANRIHLLPFLDFFTPKFEKLFSTGGIKNFDDPDLQGLDLEQERAQNEREQRIARARDNALAEQRLHDRAAVERSVQTEFLTPMRESLLALQKKIFRHGANAEICREILWHDFPKLLAQLGAGHPDLALATAHAEPDQPADFVI